MNLLEGIAELKGDSGVIRDARYDDWDTISEGWASKLGVLDKPVGSWTLGRAPSKDVIDGNYRTNNN